MDLEIFRVSLSTQLQQPPGAERISKKKIVRKICRPVATTRFDIFSRRHRWSAASVSNIPSPATVVCICRY